ncbi:hypothetical protein BJX64DRAFT_263707 [Aspergillus heterothallicus]
MPIQLSPIHKPSSIMTSLPSLRPNNRRTDNPLRPQSRVILPPRRKVSLACTNCRTKKIRCDGTTPLCLECIKAGSRCSYEHVDKRKTETWRSAIAELELKNRQLEEIIQSLKCNSVPQAIERLQQLRGDVFTPSERHLQALSSGSSEHSTHEVTAAGTSSLILPTPSSRSSTSRTVSSEVVTVDLGYAKLPTEEMTCHAVSAFMLCGSTLFHVMSKERSDDLIDRVYREQPGVTKNDICQLCALAAVGSQYCTTEIPAFAKENYYQQACALLEDLDDDDLVAMRVFTCLSVYLILLKSTSAKTMTASGLNVGRANMQKRLQETYEDDRIEWARIYRTLAFTECWLSSTLGYEFGLWPEEIQLVIDLADLESAMNPDNQVCTRLIQRHVFNVAFLSAQVYEYIRSADHISMNNLQDLSAQLDSWHRELPQSLHLCSLTSSNTDTNSMRRPLLFMHMIHISSQITLYERIMYTSFSELLGTSESQIVQEVFRLPASSLETYGSFAQQLARIIKLLYDEECVLARCWLTIHASFHAAVVLLMLATQHLALGAPPVSVMEDLAHVRVCLQVLNYCENYDIAAMRLVDVVAPLSARVWQSIEKANETENVAPSFPLSESAGGPQISARLAHIVHQLVAAMGLQYQEIWV